MFGSFQLSVKHLVDHLVERPGRQQVLHVYLSFRRRQMCRLQSQLYTNTMLSRLHREQYTQLHNYLLKRTSNSLGAQRDISE